MTIWELIGNSSWGHPTIAENLVIMALYIALTFLFELGIAWIYLNSDGPDATKKQISKTDVYIIIILGNIMSGLFGFIMLQSILLF